MTAETLGGFSAATWRARRFRTLLVAQLGLLLSYPYLGGSAAGGVLLVLLNAAVMVAAVYAASPSAKAFVLGVALAALSSAGDLAVAAGSTQLRVWAAAGDTFFFCFVAAVLFAEVFRTRTIDHDVLAGAACCFVLIALTWSSAYAWLEASTPGSFTLAAGADPWRELLYFSFVTLTTLGYGEITPVGDAARSLALLEATVGVLYSAILVARLVGLSASSAPDALGGTDR